MDKASFFETLEYYINFLLFDRDEIFELSMIANFHIDREEIDKGLNEFEISDMQKANLLKADIAYMKDIDEVLEWWYKDGIYSLREKYKNEIKKEQWYWWLDEIRDGSYQFEMIPEYLHDICKGFYINTRESRLWRSKLEKKFKENFYDLLEYYSGYLLDELIKSDKVYRVSTYSYYRQNLDIGFEKYSLDKKQREILFETDIQLIINIGKILFWWKNDNVFSLRDTCIDEIKKEQWYWWFDEIKDGIYPFEMLPEHLKDVCKGFYNN